MIRTPDTLRAAADAEHERNLRESVDDLVAAALELAVLVKSW